MPTAEEFQEYARESLQAAANAKTEAERLAFLQMAQTWSRAAMASGMPIEAPVDRKADPCTRD